MRISLWPLVLGECKPDRLKLTQMALHLRHSSANHFPRKQIYNET